MNAALSHPDPIRRLLTYSDWANALVLDCAAQCTDGDLDRGLEIGPGPGTLRRVLMHTWAGEDTWLRRWREEPDVPWPNESEMLPIAELRRRFDVVAAARVPFIASLTPDRLAREQVYRDSKGSLFRATLLDMLLQGITHSTHHRAQAVNVLRRLGRPAPEVDYMMHLRKPA
jgi:uncharacterized damage-inducible protein DinB